MDANNVAQTNSFPSKKFDNPPFANNVKLCDTAQPQTNPPIEKMYKKTLNENRYWKRVEVSWKQHQVRVVVALVH